MNYDEFLETGDRYIGKIFLMTSVNRKKRVVDILNVDNDGILFVQVTSDLEPVGPAMMAKGDWILDLIEFTPEVSTEEESTIFSDKRKAMD